MTYQEKMPVGVAEYLQKWVDGLNMGNVAVAEEAFHPDCVIHINGNPQRDLSLDDLQQTVAGTSQGLAGLHFTINDQFALGEKVSTRWTAKGTNTGPFGELQATGRKVEIEGLIIDYVLNEKVKKLWELWDQMATMQQLGIA